ncbi:MAG: hypothetical protein JW841_02055 [Deltaproteobacteria bacterium]|nr:hypothetical protein [Deltaproteobacteria bacterium]
MRYLIRYICFCLTFIIFTLAYQARAVSKDQFDFDLLGKPETPPPPAVDPQAVERRRLLLNVHQGLGISLIASTTALCIIGQLSYNDMYTEAGGTTARYKKPHKYLAYGTMGLFTTTALAAIIAPVPFERNLLKFDRSLVHKIFLFTAAAAMATSGYLGYKARNHLGYNDQKSIAKTHLWLGYISLGAILSGVGVMVF